MDIYASTARSSSCSCDPQRPSTALNPAPAEFDSAAHPILAEHWFGVRPFRPISEIAVGVAADLKRQRQVAHLHSLGPRPVLEALIEIAAGGELDTVLADYARLDREVVVALGGGLFPPSIFAVGAT